MNTHRLPLLISVFFLIIPAITAGAPNPESAYAWKQETENYRVYVGVVPASEVTNPPRVADEQKQIHGALPEKVKDTSHVMVTVYRKLGNTRVTNATIIADVGLRDGNKTVKPLEKMELKGRVAYGNFFTVHQEKEHEVRIKIYEPNRNGYEEAIFSHTGF